MKKNRNSKNLECKWKQDLSGKYMQNEKSEWEEQSKDIQVHFEIVKVKAKVREEARVRVL